MGVQDLIKRLFLVGLTLTYGGGSNIVEESEVE